MFVKYARQLRDSQYYPEPGDLLEFKYLPSTPIFSLQVSTAFDESQKFGLKEYAVCVNTKLHTITVNWSYSGISYVSKGLYKQLSGTVPE